MLYEKITSIEPVKIIQTSKHIGFNKRNGKPFSIVHEYRLKNGTLLKAEQISLTDSRCKSAKCTKKMQSKPISHKESMTANTSIAFRIEKSISIGEFTESLGYKIEYRLGDGTLLMQRKEWGKNK